MIILTAITVKDKHWRVAGFFFAISIQVKQLGLLLAPWILYQMWKEKETNSFHSILGKVSQGLILGFLPFLGYYIQKPDLLLLPLTGGSPSIYNPFAWNFLDLKLFGWNPQWLIYWNSFFTYAQLIAIGIAIAVIARREKLEFIISSIPLASFWYIVKSLKWGQFWYSIVSPGFTFCFSQRKILICLLLVLHLMQGLRSTRLILNKPFGRLEEKQYRTLMASCMFACNLKQTSSFIQEKIEN